MIFELLLRKSCYNSNNILYKNQERKNALTGKNFAAVASNNRA